MILKQKNFWCGMSKLKTYRVVFTDMRYMRIKLKAPPEEGAISNPSRRLHNLKREITMFDDTYEPMDYDIALVDTCEDERMKAEFYDSLPAEPLPPGGTKRTRFRIKRRRGFICLIGTGGGVAVRNRAGIAVRWLRIQGYDLNANRVLCRDVKGSWDELIVENGLWDDFCYLGRTNLNGAIAEALRISPNR